MSKFKSTGTVLGHVAILVNDIQEKLNLHYKENQPDLIPPQVCVDVGDVFVRIYHHNVTLNSIWAVGFVMLDTGNIRMPLGLKAFDRYNVGSVMDDDNGLSLVTHEGLIKPTTDVPSSYDPDYKSRKRQDSPKTTIIRKKPTVTHDHSPEAEAKRQREYGNLMKDDD